MKFDVVVTKTGVRINGFSAQRIYCRNAVRKIFFWKDYVIKIERSENGREWLHQCRTEYETWKSLSRKDRKYFAEIFDYKHTNEYDYIIQKRVEIPKTHNSRYSRLYDNKIEPIISKYGLCDIHEGRDKNWKALSETNFVIFDYGL